MEIMGTPRLGVLPCFSTEFPVYFRVPRVCSPQLSLALPPASHPSLYTRAYTAAPAAAAARRKVSEGFAFAARGVAYIFLARMS